MFPTKKEGKYILKLRECQLNDSNERSSVCKSNKSNESNETNEINKAY